MRTKQVAWIPKQRYQPDILLFEFLNGRLDSICHTDCWSREQALQDYRTKETRFIETKLIVLPKKGRRKNPISHKFAHLEKDHVGVWFAAAIDAHTFQQMCDNADTAWAKEKEALHAEIRDAAHNTGNAKFDRLPIRLQTRIQIGDSGCWLWSSLNRRNKRGNLQPSKQIDRRIYGTVRFRGKRWLAYRLVYSLLVGEIPTGMLLRHRCDTPACVNPHHLELGITEDNVRDMVSRGRASWQIKRSSRERKRQTYLRGKAGRK